MTRREKQDRIVARMFEALRDPSEDRAIVAIARTVIRMAPAMRDETIDEAFKACRFNEVGMDDGSKPGDRA